ncbi:MAG: class I SAM-dependent methyltransferase [Acidimicrobiia bacterium]|nr:class I SAM-dependent methyltransferase [Acidimicrobiia bacterium]
MGSSVRTAYWDERYRAVDARNASWHQDHPTVSLALLDAIGEPLDAPVVDVGGGASRLVDHLLGRGNTDVTVLDVSSHALGVARARLPVAAPVTWLHQDVLTWEPSRLRRLWHDRAVLHFLVDDRDRAAYLSVMRRALAPGAGFVVGTFAEDGPDRCSGLPVRRYPPAELAALLAPAEVVEQRREVHVTPGGAPQPFTWVAGRLPGEDSSAR